MTYPSMVAKLVASLVIILIYLKLSSNSQLSPLTASDQVGNIVLGALVGGTMAEEISTLMLCVALALWGGMLLGIRALKYRSPRFSSLVDGHRVPLVQDGRLITSNFNSAKLSPEDFLMSLHQMKIDNVNEVRNVWLEPSGELTIDKNHDALLSRVLISNGSAILTALAGMERDCDWLLAKVREQGFSDIRNVFMAEWHDDKLWCYPYHHAASEKEKEG